MGPRADPRRVRRRVVLRRRVVPGAARDRHRHRWLDPPARGRHRRRSAPSRPTAGSRATASWRWRARSTRPARAPAPCSTPPCCTRSSPGTTRWTPPRSTRRCRRWSRRPAAPTCTGLRIGIVRELDRRGLPGRRADPLRRGRAAPASTPAPRSSRSRCPSFTYALAAYYLILPSEASSNLAKFDAMRYGLRVAPEGVDAPSAEQVMAATRDAGFGDEVKRRIILGTYALSSGYYDAYYGSAQKVRRLIAQRLHRGVRAGRRAGQPHGADHRVQARRQARRPDGDVPQRHRDHPGQPGRHPRHVGAERPGRRRTACRPASRSSRRPCRTTGCTPWARPSRRGSPPLGRADPRPRPGARRTAGTTAKEA